MLELNTFVVKQKAKMLSSRNSYEILDEEGKLVGTAEQQTGGLAMLVGMVLGEPPTQIDFREKTDAGEPLVFSVMLNDFTCSDDEAKAAVDAFVQALAKAAGW